MDKRSNQSAETFLSAGTTRAIIALLLVLAVVTTVRIRLLNMPLERDEGEYAYAGQLILQGVPPYQEAYNMKWPGTFAAYALIMAMFGQTAGGIHAGLILVNLATAALVFLLARRMCGNAGGVVAAGTYALLSINPGTLGLFAHATHFVMLPALAGIVLLQNLDDDTSPTRIFAAGLSLGLAALMKQSGAAFGIFAAVWVVRQEVLPPGWCGRRLAVRLGCLALGGILPLVLTCSVLEALGVFDRFWLWTFQYARAYASMVTLAQGLKAFFITSTILFKGAPGPWCLAGLGLILLWGEQSLARWRFFIISLLFFSFVAVCPGWYFRRHYFIQFLPAAGLLAAVTFSATSSFFARRALFPLALAAIPSLIFALAGVGVLIQGRDIYFRLAPAQVCREIYGTNPFPEAVAIGRYLAAHCPPDARIAVIGSEPEIYFYSHRRSATGYIYTYPLMEPLPYALPMQQEMIREVEKADPDYLVFVNVKFSWIQRTNSNVFIFEWFPKYCAEHFQLAGLVEIYPDHTDYQWTIPKSGVTPRSMDRLAIFRNNKLPAPDKASAAHDDSVATATPRTPKACD